MWIFAIALFQQLRNNFDRLSNLRRARKPEQAIIDKISKLTGTIYS
jgi:hypothetical protein